MAKDLKLLSVKDVAAELNLSEQSVRNLINKGEIPSENVGNQWIFKDTDIVKFKKANKYRIEPFDHERLENKKHKINALSFFSGAMGLDIGMENAGIHTLLACEFDKSCRTTIQANRPNVALIGDIWKYNSAQILEMAKLDSASDVDVIYGGPPCQAFSTAGTRQAFNDERGNVFLKYINIISEIKPKYVVIENVRGLLSTPMQHKPHAERNGKEYETTEEMIPGTALLYIVKLLKEIGYTISFNLYNAANFGSPQIRERCIMICYLGNEKMPYLTPTHSENGEFGLPRWRTISEVMSDLKEDEQHYIKFPESRLVYYRQIKEGENWRALPADMQKEAMGNSYNAGGGKTGFYRRLSYSKPSPTLVTHPAMPATDLGHPTADRPLSVEEYKRIQEFPDDWTVCGSLQNQYKQIGNAVPIKLGEAIGRTIINHIEGKQNIQYDGFKYSRYKNTDETSWESDVRKALKKFHESRSTQVSMFD